MVCSSAPTTRPSLHQPWSAGAFRTRRSSALCWRTAPFECQDTPPNLDTKASACEPALLSHATKYHLLLLLVKCFALWFRPVHLAFLSVACFGAHVRVSALFLVCVSSCLMVWNSLLVSNFLGLMLYSWWPHRFLPSCDHPHVCCLCLVILMLHNLCILLSPHVCF